MRVLSSTVIILLSLAASQQPRGLVSNLTAEADVSIGTVRFVVRGTNPCGAVRLNYGDGTEAVTHAIRDLPFSYSYEYTRVGDFAVSAEGMGNCDGIARSRIRVTTVRPQPPPPPPARATPAPPLPPPPPPPAPNIRFASMDRNTDHVVSRAEWHGSARSFALHDWNGDGRLSGEEVRFGAAQPLSSGRGARGGNARPAQGPDWSDTQFRELDRNRDNRLSRAEWPYDIEDFVRIDRNRDNQVVLNEYLPGETDDDRGDRFEDLDLNGDTRIDRGEWHGSVETFRWLDQNNDGTLSHAEVAGTSDQGSRAGRGRAADAGIGAGRGNSQTISVSSGQAWTDTGIDVGAGDVLTIRASGRIQFSSNSRDVAEPDGAPGRAATAKAPLPMTVIGALIGRVGTSGPFVVGATLEAMRTPRAGRLYLGVNDDALRDNRGAFQVTVTVSRGNER